MPEDNCVLSALRLKGRNTLKIFTKQDKHTPNTNASVLSGAQPSRSRTVAARSARALTALSLLCLAGLSSISAASAQDPNGAKFAADSENVVYAGRVEPNFPDKYSPSTTDTLLFWPGTELRVGFNGTSVGIDLGTSRDLDGKGAQTFIAFVDGQRLDIPELTNLETSGQYIQIASGLDGSFTHQLVIRINGDAASGKPEHAWIRDIVLDPGQTLAPGTPLPSRRIEFYGDSVTAGCCLAPASENSDPNFDNQWLQDQYNTFASQTARNEGADARYIAKGSVGLLRSFIEAENDGVLSKYWNKLYYDGFETDTSLIPDYGLGQWKPQVVVLAFGHNDIFKSVPEADFINAYKTLISQLQGAYPGVKIFCMNTAIDDPTQGTYYTNTFDAINSAGFSDVYTQTFAFDGHAGHPRRADHDAMAQQLTNWINSANVSW